MFYDVVFVAQRLLCSNFFDPKRASIHEDYYSAAVENGEELFTFILAGKTCKLLKLS